MLQTLKSRRNRKGFTLAELLIVVAIIAVLVAIAVPLFVGALNDAEKRVGEANIRAVRAAAVEKILMNNDKDGEDNAIDYQHVESGSSTVAAVAWTIKAYVSAGGELHDMTIKPSATTLPASATYTKLTAAVAAPGVDAGNIAEVGEYQIDIVLTELTATKG